MPRYFLPPKDKARRIRYYALLGAARKAPMIAQRVALLKRAEALRIAIDAGPVDHAAEGEAGMPDSCSTTTHTPRSASGRRKAPRDGTTQ